MGLDVKDIKGVVHYNFPKFLETYIQQIGRSGRNGETSECFLLLNQEDFYFVRNKTLSEFFINLIDVRNFVDFLLDKSQNYIYFSSQVIKGRLGIKEEAFDKILTIIKILLEEKFKDNYYLYYNIKNQFNIKNFHKEKKLDAILSEYFGSSDLPETIKNELEGFIKGKIVKKQEVEFRLDELINSFSEPQELHHIYYLIKQMDKIGGLSVQSSNPGCYIKFSEPVPEIRQELLGAFEE